MRKEEGLLWIPKRIWPVVKKCARNRGYEHPKGREKGDHIIFMSGAPLAIVAEIIGSIEKGDVKAVELPMVAQRGWTEYNKKERILTVHCPKSGKIVGVGRNCVPHKRTKGYRGATRIMGECEHYVSIAVDHIVCIHPKADQFCGLSPWKNPEGIDGLPLFEFALQEVVKGSNIHVDVEGGTASHK